VITNNGIATEAAYPYTGNKVTCAYTTSEKGAYITSYTGVTTGSESALQTAVVSQPVIVAIDAGQPSFQLYDAGIYSDPGCSSALAELDHAVAVVGYSVNSSGSAYWIIKNSWGTDWGIDGYLYLARNDNNMCGVATYAFYPVLASTTSSSSAKASTTSTTTKATTTSTSTTTKSSTTSTTAKASTTSTTAKASTTGTSTTTGKVSTTTTAGTTTTAKATTSTTGSTTNYIYQDSLAHGWTVAGSSTVTGLTTTATGYSGDGISAVLPTGASLTFTSATAIAFDNIQVYIQASAAATLNFQVAGYNPLGLSVPTGWEIQSIGLGGASETSFAFVNEGAAVTLYLDNISWS